ncbi:MAG: DNA cytosine methyltransferase, partial [Waterburya sp.]
MPTAATFFSGIGGACHGLKLAGYNVIFGTDLWEFVEPIWKSFNPSADFWSGNFLDIKREQIPDADLFWFSPPCQDFSLANPKKGSNIQRNFEIAEQIYYLVKGKLPQTVIIENVPNFQKS